MTIKIKFSCTNCGPKLIDDTSVKPEILEKLLKSVCPFCDTKISGGNNIGKVRRQLLNRAAKAARQAFREAASSDFEYRP